MTEQIREQPAQIDELLSRKAGAIATFVGGDYDMTVGVGPEGSGWHWDFEKNHVNMDAHDLLYESEDVIRGVASHEGNHRIASRAEHVQDMWREPGFSFGFNAVEDPRVNTAGMNLLPGTRPWIKAYIEKDLSEGGGLNYLHMNEGAEQKLGYVPSHMKWGAEMIRYWYEKELADTPLDQAARQAFLDKIPDEDVREAVAHTIDSFEKYYQTIPESRDETEVQRKAAQSAATFKNHIWPEYHKLVEQAYEDQAAADMLQDMMDGEQGGQGSSIIIPFDSLPPEIQDEIRQKMNAQSQPGVQSGGQSGQSETQQEQNSSGEGQGEQSDGADGASEGQQSGASQGQGQGQGQGNGSQQGQGQEQSQSSSANSSQSQGENQGQSTGKQVPWDELSEQAKEAVRQAFSNLDPEAQDEYKQQAEQQLEDAEDEANEKLRGKMTDPGGNETKQETREREAKEAQEAEQNGQTGQTGEAAEAQDAAAEAERQKQEQQRQKDIEQMIRSMQQRRERAVKNLPDNPYQQYLNDSEVRTALVELDHDFKQIFTPNEMPGTRHTYAGLRPSMRRAMQFEADPRRSNIFEAKGRPREKSHRFLWSGDLSGSMDGIIDLIFKAIVIDVELANKHGLESAVVGFSSDGGPENVMVFKDFEPRRLNRQARERLGAMPSSGGGGTPLYEATEVGYHMLKQRNSQARMKNNYFQTFTDGGPTDASPRDLAELIRTIRKDREIITSGFGIGPSTRYVDDIYPELPKQVREAIAKKIKKPSGDISNSFDNVADFARAFVVTMRFQVEHPELFYD